MRLPAVAGQFYPASKEGLQNEIKKCFLEAGEPKKCKNENKILAAVTPHAGYAYSGSTAAFAYKVIAEDRKPEAAVIIGPNHSGFGSAVSVYPRGEWSTPLGSVAVNASLAEEIGKDFSLDEGTHAYEHSAEVQIPFLQHIYGKDISIIPICVLDHRLETMLALGKRLAEVLDPAKHIVLASSDFSHYVPYNTAYEKDFMAINAIKRLDVNLLYDIIRNENISMCGSGPVAAAIIYAKAAGAKHGELLKYTTSGDIIGDKSSVVGYASIIMRR